MKNVFYIYDLSDMFGRCWGFVNVVEEVRRVLKVK